MSIRRLQLVVLAVAVAAVAVLAGVLFAARASAAAPDPGYGPGMMGSYQAGTATAGGGATLLIRHQYAHCHTWSLNGGAFKAAQRVTLARGATLTVIDDDVMPHRLVKLAGSAVTMRNGTATGMMGGYTSQTPGLMSHMGASTTVSFSKPGIYRFRTRAGEDYMPGIRTGGADSVLTLTVAVR